MKLATVCILLLAISEPLLINAKKVVVVVPRQIRRSPMIPRRHNNMQFKKSYGSNSPFHYHVPNQPHIYRARKPPPFSKGPPYPHGGDDFDQGHESVNHVPIPYGKGVSHGISFGKGYIPYENIKNGYPQDRERYYPFVGRKHREPEYSPSNFPPSGSEYSGAPSAYRSYRPRIPENYPPESGSYGAADARFEESKYYAQRSIGQDLTGGKGEYGSPNSVSTIGENPPVLRGTELFKDVDGGQTSPAYEGQGERMEGAVVLPAGIPAATIGGNKQGIVIRDTVSLDEYKKTVNEFTKTWPNAFLPQQNAQQSIDFLIQQQQQQQQTQPTFSPGTFDPSSFRGSVDWPAGFAQPKQGYDVKEDVPEPPHDFRATPIQTSSLQTIPNNLLPGAPAINQFIHG